MEVKKVKAFLVMFITIITLIPVVTFANQSQVNIVVNRIKVEFPDAQPFIDENGRTLVPVRFVSEALGAKVDWFENTNTVTINRGTDVISLTINQKTIVVNGVSKELDTSATLFKERTFVPIRFVSEALGEKILWDEVTKTVNVGEPEDNAESLEYFRVGEWIYFSNTNYDSSIFKIKVDGTGRTRLNFDNSTIFQIEGDWVYYLNIDEQNLYKIKTDGTQKTLLGEFPHISLPNYFHFIKVKDGWVYYSDNSDGLYRVSSTDNREKLGDAIGYAIISDDGIYYQKGRTIQSMNLDGTENKTIVSSGVTSYGSYTDWMFDEWIYYKNYDTDELFIVSKDGSKKVKLPITMFATDIVQISDGWVYYVINNNGLAILGRIKTDGAQDTKIVEMEQYSKPVIKDNWVYYNNHSKSISKLYKIQLNGSNKTKINDDSFGYAELFIEDVDDGWIYFGSSMYNSISLYRVRLDGSEKIKLWEAHNNYDGGS